MSIGIFGDSFAACQPPLGGVIFNGSERESFDNMIVTVSPTWASLLPDSTKHALGGTDLSWSFLEFLDHHEKYDKIVFVVTDPNRITLRTPHLDMTKGWDMPDGGLRISAVTPGQAANKKQKFEKLSQGEMSQHDLYARDAYNTIEKWQTYIQQQTPERDWLHYSVLINELQRIRPDIKLIKAFNHPSLKMDDHRKDSNPNVRKFAIKNYYPYKQFDNIPLDSEAGYLYNIVRAENSKQSFHERVENPVKWWDLRAGHISTESHIKLNKVMTAWLQTNDTWLNFDIEEFKNNNVHADDCFVEVGTQLLDWQAAFLQRRKIAAPINTKYDGKNR